MAVYRKGDNYYIDYYVNDRRVREMIGPSLKLAETVLAKRRVAVAENRHLEVLPTGTVTFEEAARRFIEYSKVHKRSWSRDIGLVKNLARMFARRKLGSIVVEDVHKYQAQRSRAAAPATVNHEIAALKRIFNLCIQWKLVRYNPVSRIRMLREDNTRKRFLMEKEEALLMIHAPEHLKPIIVTALHTGMRRGEILDLKWADVDLDNRVIYVRHSKTGRSREIPINDTLLETFSAMPRHIECPNVFWHWWGKPYQGVRTAFEAAVKRAGITDFRFHDLRHTAASRMVQRGVSLRAVQILLGHNSWAATLRYAHLADEQLKSAVAKLEGWGKEVVTQVDTEGFRTNAEDRGAYLKPSGTGN